METFRAFFLLVFCVALISSDDGPLKHPFSQTFQYDLGGDPVRIEEFFNCSTAVFGFTTVHLDKETLPIGAVDSAIGLKAIVARSNEKKRLLLHVEGGGRDDGAAGLKVLKDLMRQVERPHNVYRLPVVRGSANSATQIFDTKDFLQDLDQWSSIIAFGIAEEKVTRMKREEQQQQESTTAVDETTNTTTTGGEKTKAATTSIDGNVTEAPTSSTRKPPSAALPQPPVGYTQQQIDALANATHSHCYARDTKFYVAFNALQLSYAADGVTVDFYGQFMSCRLLLYTTPSNGHPIDVRRLRSLLVDQVNLQRLLVVVPGRDIGYRLYSLPNVAWSYAVGHGRYVQGESSLADFVAQGVRTFHLMPAMVQKRKELPAAFVLAPSTTEKDHVRSNFRLDMLQYVAQFVDASHVVLLRPMEYQHVAQVMQVFGGRGGNACKLFLEARIFGRSKNATEFDEKNKQVQEYEALLNAAGGNVTAERVIFSFVEGEGEEEEGGGGEYTQDDLRAVMEHYGNFSSRYGGVKWGIMLEVAQVTERLDFKALVRQPNFSFLFLTAGGRNNTNVTEEETLQRISRWIGAFDEQMVLLKFDHQPEKVHAMFRHFARAEPEDRSAVRKSTTAAPVFRWEWEVMEEGGRWGEGEGDEQGDLGEFEWREEKKDDVPRDLRANGGGPGGMVAGRGVPQVVVGLLGILLLAPVHFD